MQSEPSAAVAFAADSCCSISSRPTMSVVLVSAATSCSRVTCSSAHTSSSCGSLLTAAPSVEPPPSGFVKSFVWKRTLPMCMTIATMQ